MEQRALALAAGAMLLFSCRGGTAGGVASDPGTQSRPPAFAGDAHVHVPDNVRVTVEVLNATHVHGLARRATEYLRDRGFDVVLSGTVPEQRDTTLVLDRSRHPDWAAFAVRALGHARAEERPDSLRDVDLTVLLGASWRPPAQPFYP
jgi:hypothetical protein